MQSEGIRCGVDQGSPFPSLATHLAWCIHCPAVLRTRRYLQPQAEAAVGSTQSIQVIEMTQVVDSQPSADRDFRRAAAFICRDRERRDWTSLCKTRVGIGFMPEFHGIPNSFTKTRPQMCRRDEHRWRGHAIHWCLVPCQLQPNWNQLKSLVQLGLCCRACLPNNPHILKSCQIYWILLSNLSHINTIVTIPWTCGQTSSSLDLFHNVCNVVVSRWCLLLS